MASRLVCTCFILLIFNDKILQIFPETTTLSTKEIYDFINTIKIDDPIGETPLKPTIRPPMPDPCGSTSGPYTSSSRSDRKKCNFCVPMNMCQTYKNTDTPNTNGAGFNNLCFGESTSDSLHVCCDKLRTESLSIVPYHQTATCGVRNEHGVGFKIALHVSEAQFGEFPWMVAIIGRKETGDQYLCGGSLIHPRVVLTAAHCIHAYRQMPENLTIRAGEWDTHSIAERIPFQERIAEAVITHKGYQSGPAYNNIALVFVREEFEFAENVDVICLPPPNLKLDNILTCVASGWGDKPNGKNNINSNILKKIDLPIVPKYQCENLLRTTCRGKNFQLDDSSLCAGGIRGVDTCSGDGGGPLVCPVPCMPDRYFQAGIVSWGNGCGSEIPGIYTNVPHMRNWIDEQLNAKLKEHTRFYDP